MVMMECIRSLLFGPQCLLVQLETTVGAEQSIQISELRAIIARVVRVVEVVIVIVGAEGQQLKRCPAKNIPAVPVECVPQPQHHPDYCSAYVQWSV